MPHTRPRALVVDDSDDAADSFARILRALGCEATFVTDPLVALEVADRFKPEVVFLDIAMPSLTGNDLARMLRAKYGWTGLKIVAVTALGGEDDRARAREAGFDAHVVKPVEVRLIESMLQTLFPEMRWR